jgi:predicted Ser/Thr protein kinase
METLRLCTECREPLPADSKGRICVRCQTDPGRATPPPASPAGSAAPPPHPAEIAQFFPQLEILELVGHGGMGMVYKARQPQLDRLVALKILAPALSGDAAFAERFTREAQSLARLNHSNVVGVYDFGRAGSFYYFLMEYVDGESLFTMMHEDKPALDEIRRIVIEICRALQYAHEEGVIHRDIKPSNILIDKKGRVKIADFGLAKLAGATGGNPALTTMVMGTPHYMAPEQIERPSAVDHRADLYSLGVVFYELLTGELPLGRFEAPSRKSTGVDERLDGVVLRALEKSPDSRYQHASEIRADVEAATGPDTTAQLPVAVKVAPPRWSLLSQLALMAGTAVLAVFLYVLVSNHWPWKKNIPRPPGAQVDFSRGGEGTALGPRLVTALQLTKAQVPDINRTIRRYQREYITLEHQHTDHKRDKAGHVHITITPFPDDVHQLMARFWNDLGGLMSAEQVTKAQALNFDRYFPNSGLSTVHVELWRDPNGEEHYVESSDPNPNTTPSSPIGKPMPQRYRSYLQENQ